MVNILQANIEKGYDRFLNLVARGRDLDKTGIDAIAQGRVWSGTRALELGLVDSLGNLDDAIEMAASIAGISDDYQLKRLQQPLTPRQLLLQQVVDSLGKAGLSLLQDWGQPISQRCCRNLNCSA